jgi:hypothetical protein
MLFRSSLSPYVQAYKGVQIGAYHVHFIEVYEVGTRAHGLMCFIRISSLLHLFHVLTCTDSDRIVFPFAHV